MPYSIYILECRDGTYYTGYTTDISKRIDTHNSGKWAKYTRGKLPVKLIYSESFETESAARKREYEIKKLTKKEKLLLISP
jgi:putative endonuclease